MKVQGLMLALIVALSARSGRAQDKTEEKAKDPTGTPAAARNGAGPVRAGKTTVTVIDEGDSIESIVERVRAARSQDSFDRQRQPATPGATGDLAPNAPPARAGREPVTEGKRTAGDRPVRPALRERVRERLREGKPVAPRLEKRLERLRNR